MLIYVLLEVIGAVFVPIGYATDDPKMMAWASTISICGLLGQINETLNKGKR